MTRQISGTVYVEDFDNMSPQLFRVPCYVEGDRSYTISRASKWLRHCHDVYPSCSEDQMEDKWAVMLSPFSRKYTPLKFAVKFDERKVLFLLHNMLVHTTSASDSQREEKIQHDAFRRPRPGVSKVDLQCTNCTFWRADKRVMSSINLLLKAHINSQMQC